MKYMDAYSWLTDTRCTHALPALSVVCVPTANHFSVVMCAFVQVP